MITKGLLSLVQLAFFLGALFGLYLAGLDIYVAFDHWLKTEAVQFRQLHQIVGSIATDDSRIAGIVEWFLSVPVFVVGGVVALLFFKASEAAKKKRVLPKRKQKVISASRRRRRSRGMAL